MNLIIDIGNTQSKAALFVAGKLIDLKLFPGEITISQLKKFISGRKKISSAILSSVVNHSKKINKFLSQNFYFIELDDKTRLPIKNLYKTPKTLGKDRLANSVGANFLFRDQNVLAIDAGTCIKYDFVNSRNEYLGGAISPGLDMRFRALHRFTAHLPLLKRKTLPVYSKAKNTPFPFGGVNGGLIGQTTSDSILSGVQNGAVAETSGIIRKYRDNFENLTVIFTGGDILFFNYLVSKKNRIFARPDLTLLGLNVILNFNNEII